MYYLAVCAIVKNEDAYLKEWLYFHALRGVEHFYIYDNDSDVPVTELLKDVPRHLYTCFRVSGSERQIPSYNHAIEKLKNECYWLGFIDADEFVFPMQGSDLRPYLAEFEQYAGLAFTWTLFGSIPHLRRPKGLVLENYLFRYPDKDHPWNNLIKCFVQPRKIKEVLDPHQFMPAKDQMIVNEEHFPLPLYSSTARRSREIFSMNHYFYKSQEEFGQKLARGRADNQDEKVKYAYEEFYNQVSRVTEKDTVALRFVSELHNALASNSAQIFDQETGQLNLHEAIDMLPPLISQGRYEEAETLLCRTAFENRYMPELWSLRSMMARGRGDARRALIFAKKAHSLFECMEHYWELLQNFISLGQKDKAARTLVCARVYLNRRGPELKASWKERLAAVERGLG